MLFHTEQRLLLPPFCRARLSNRRSRFCRSPSPPGGLGAAAVYGAAARIAMRPAIDAVRALALIEVPPLSHSCLQDAKAYHGVTRSPSRRLLRGGASNRGGLRPAHRGGLRAVTSPDEESGVVRG